VLLQFLAEAVAMAFAGGLSGILLAGGVLEIISRATSLPAVVPLWAAGLGILFSAAVGLSAGILPALKAAGLNVIDALRYE
jgi:putative ABC transport system permease protein